MMTTLLLESPDMLDDGQYILRKTSPPEPVVSDAWNLREGIYTPSIPIAHREEEYDSTGFDTLRKMQDRHFWYRGRHRFLLHAVRRYVRKYWEATQPPRIVDLGGGCGGWLEYLLARKPFTVAETALADSSLRALEYASECLPSDVTRYQIDLLDLRWRERWDVAFLLDVLEHIPEDGEALAEIYRSLSPGGLLFVTTPALTSFWTWNDDLANHQRRYAKHDFRRLAEECGFELMDARYFMFFLSPLLLLSRWTTRPDLNKLSKDDLWRLFEKMHRVPHPAINGILEAVFNCETPMGHYARFPWGTSILAILRKPAV